MAVLGSQQTADEKVRKGFAKRTWNGFVFEKRDRFGCALAREWHSTIVLAHGGALVVGGEDNSGAFALTNQGAIYHPKANIWTIVPGPSKIKYLGDAPAVVLPNGKFLVVGGKIDQTWPCSIPPLSLGPPSPKPASPIHSTQKKLDSVARWQPRSLSSCCIVCCSATRLSAVYWAKPREMI
jgi:hypothetical protein